MSQLHFYVPDETEAELRKRAKQLNLPLSRYLAKLASQEVARKSQWPDGYFEQVFGQWQGTPLSRAPQGDYENRKDLL